MALEAWRVTCTCGWERKASSAWAATAVARRHAQLLLDSPASDHTIRVEEPPAELRRGSSGRP